MLVTTQLLSEVNKALDEIADGARYKVEHLYDDQFQVLVENDEFYNRQDEGPDPYYSVIFTARIA